MTTGSIAARVPVARRGMRAALIGTTSLVFLIVVIVGGIVSWPTRSATYAPSPVAVADIPADYLSLYQQAAARFGIDWAVLAAIGKIECDHGSSQAAGRTPMPRRPPSGRRGGNPRAGPSPPPPPPPMPAGRWRGRSRTSAASPT